VIDTPVDSLEIDQLKRRFTTVCSLRSRHRSGRSAIKNLRDGYHLRYHADAALHRLDDSKVLWRDGCHLTWIHMRGVAGRVESREWTPFEGASHGGSRACVRSSRRISSTKMADARQIGTDDAITRRAPMLVGFYVLAAS